MPKKFSTVKWFDAKKGYGFLDHPEGGDDVFVHYSQIESEQDFKTLRTGQQVEFELNDGPKGLHALGVVPMDEEEGPSSASSEAARSDGEVHSASDRLPSHTLSHEAAHHAAEAASSPAVEATDPPPDESQPPSHEAESSSGHFSEQPL